MGREAVEKGSQKGLKTTLIGIIVSALLALVKAAGGVYQPSEDCFEFE